MLERIPCISPWDILLVTGTVQTVPGGLAGITGIRLLTGTSFPVMPSTAV